MPLTGAALFQSMKDKNDPLVLAPLNSMVIAHKWTAGASYIPATICDPTTGALLQLAPGWFTLGELQKKAGVDMTPDRKTSDVEGLGSLAPRRTLITSEGMAIDFTAQEWRKVNQSLYYGTDLSSTFASATTGEWRASKSPSPTAEYWTVMVLAYDGITGAEVYPYWIYPKCMSTKSGKSTLADGSEIAFPTTLSVYADNAYVSSSGTTGALYDFGVAGIGNIALAEAGGYMLATSITVTPATVSLSMAGVHTQQLKVVDSNGADVTSQCTYTSATPADATVSSSGLITGVAVGSSVVTASYTPLGATTPLTGTCTATVTA